ncbi:MAG: hypothetical protein ACERKD_16555 [Prolixibacteraceae bacterium]
MIRYISLLLLVFLFSHNISWGQQNLFDCHNSKRFAQYLYNTGQFELSIHELERIQFFCESDTNSQLLLLKSYRKLKKYDEANLFFIDKTIDDIGQLPPDFCLEYIRLNMAQNNYNLVNNAIQQGLVFPGMQEHQLGATLLQKNWQKAFTLSQSAPPNTSYQMSSLIKVAHKSYAIKYKKPWIATLLSVVVPGSGKMYSGYWGDGAISFLFTASSSFFAYRAFQKYGTSNVYPWLIGGLAVSYYTANIYGGNRAAVHYNDNLDHSIIHETENLLYSDY